MQQESRRGIWVRARQQALAASLDLVRLNTPTRAVLTLGVPVTAFAIVRLATGQWAVATIATLGLTLTVGLFVFLKELIMAPASIAEDLKAQLEDQSSEKVKSEDERRRSVMSRLVHLYKLEAGTSLAPRIAAGLALPPEDWLNEHLGEMGEVWHVFDVRGTSYSTFEILAGEWRYRGMRLRSPAAVKWAAFFDSLKLRWQSGKEVLARGAPPADFFLPDLNAWFVVSYALGQPEFERIQELHEKTNSAVILADGPPKPAQESLRAVTDHNDDLRLSWAWGQDRRDDGVYWLLKLDGSGAICLGGPGKRSDHDRAPVIGEAVKAAMKVAEAQPTPYEKP